MEEEKGDVPITSSAGSKAGSREQTAESSKVETLKVDRKDPLLGYKGLPISNRQFSEDDLLRTHKRKRFLEFTSDAFKRSMRIHKMKGETPVTSSAGSEAGSSQQTAEPSHVVKFKVDRKGKGKKRPTEQEELNKGKPESLKLSRQQGTESGSSFEVDSSLSPVIGPQSSGQVGEKSYLQLPVTPFFEENEKKERKQTRKQSSGPYLHYFNYFPLNHPSHEMSGGGYMMSSSQNKSINVFVSVPSCSENSTDVLQGSINEEEQKQEDPSNNSDLLSLFELPTRSRMLSADVSLPHEPSHVEKFKVVLECKPMGDHLKIEETRPEYSLPLDSVLQKTLDVFKERREDLSFSSTSSSQTISPSTPSHFTFPDQSPPSSQVIHEANWFFAGLNIEDQPLVLQSGAQEIDLWSFHESEGDSAPQVGLDAAVTAVTCSITNTQPARSQIQTCSSGPALIKRVYGSLPRSHDFPSPSHMTSAENNTLTRACSLPELRLEASCEQFTPDISDDEDDETYRFQCSCPGLYQCSVTGLVFHMEREGDVVYRTVPWNRKLLSQHHKQPAGPLFNIKCEQQSVCQLHLPHCQIRSTGTLQFLSVAHVNEEGIEFIVPHKITETHVIINISGFSAFGNVKDEDSPPDPVRALVLLFYRPPADPGPSSLLNVLLLPRNVVLRDVLRTRKKSVGDESYIETSPHCKLHPQQEYSLSTCPEDDTVLVDPTKAEFECDNYDNYFTSFQVHLEQTMKHMKLFLRHTTSYSVWERRVCLWSSGVNRSCGQSALNLPPDKRLWDIRSSFIEGVSAPVLKSLLAKLFEKTVMTDSEQESADKMQNKRDKARFVIDTVRKKGEAASSEMIEALCDVDHFLSEHLGLI